MKAIIPAITCLVIITSWILLMSCSSDSDTTATTPTETPVEPIITTNEVTDLTKFSATLNGSIDIGTYTLVSKGFIISKPGVTNDSTIVYVSTQDFYYNLTGLERAESYTVKAFIRAKPTPSKIIYLFAEPITFTTLNPPIQITSFYPSAGVPGDIVTIVGTEFSMNPDDFDVSFGSISAEVVSAQNNSIQVKVPAAIDEYFYKITVRSSYGSQAQTSSEWVYWHRGTWQALNNAPESSRCLFRFVIGDYAYVQFGQNGGFYKYDAINDSWSSQSQFPEDLSENLAMAAFSIGDVGYVVFHKHVYKFDPTLGNWIAMADFPGVDRKVPVGFSINGTGYLACGFSTEALVDFWKYNSTTDEWTQLADFPGNPPSGTGYAITSQGKAYFSGNGDFWIFDGSNWVEKTKHPATLAIFPRGFVLENRTYWYASGYTTFYEEDRDLWVFIKGLPDLKNYPAAFTVAGRAIICGGNENTCYRYIPPN